MEYRSLGSSGLKVSLVGIGCNNFGRRCDQQQTAKIVHCALDQGINFFDTADMYAGGLSEQYLGQAIRDRPRQDVIIASKFGNSMGKGGLKRGASRRYIMNAVDDSLRRLGTDYIDLYQQHIPDTETSIEETLRALDDLVSIGKVRYIGHSNFSGWQVSDAHWTAKYNGLNQSVTAQNLYNLLDRRIEQEVIPACEKYGVGMLPFFPLASGMLTGKYKRGTAPGEGTRLAAMGDRAAAAMSDAIFDKVEALTQFAEQSGYSLLQLAMSWLASKAVISSVIAGATSEQQVIANAQGVAWKLSDDDMNHIDELTRR
jgi:aryl-alcohol dehydrogenase-like predicted oxidoreductase